MPWLPSYMGHTGSSECVQQMKMLITTTIQPPVYVCHLQHVLSAQKTEVRPMVHSNSASNLLSSQLSGHLAHQPSGSLTHQGSGALAHQPSGLR